MQKKCIEDRLENLEKDVIGGKIDEKEFKEIYEELKQLQRRFLSCLKQAYEYSGNKPLKTMLIKLKNEDVSNLMDSLEKLGRSLDDSLRGDLEKFVYKLLEMTRMGRRSDVMYIITRMYVTNNKEIPSELLEVFKPIYDDETFKTLIYTFIGSAIKTEGEGG